MSESVRKTAPLLPQADCSADANLDARMVDSDHVCLPETRKQRFGVERLSQNSNCAARSRLREKTRFGAASDENDGRGFTTFVESPLEVDPCEPRHVDVEDYATTGMQRANLQKLFRRAIDLRFEPKQTQQSGEGHSRRLVVVYDRYRQVAHGPHLIGEAGALPPS
jgi:hypothetical protein